MDISPDQQSEKDVSLIVHVDDTQSDLEADLMASETDNVKMDTTVNEETNGRIEMEKIIEENAQKETEQTKMKGHVRPKRDQSDIDKPRNHRWNLRITGFTSKTCLDELKRLCSQYGTVLGGSISSKKQKSGVQYRASIGMSQPEEAEKCIAFLNQTKFEGHKIKVEKKRWRHNSLWRKLELSQKQEESLRLFQLGEQLRWEKMKIENLNLSKCEIGRQLLELNFLWTEVLLLNEMRNAMEISNDPRDANKRKFSGGSMRSRMNSPHTPSIFQLPFQNQSWLQEITRSVKRPLDRGNPCKGEFSSGLTGSKERNSNILSIFELPSHNQSQLEGNTHSMHQPQDQSNPDGPTQSKRKRNRRNNSHIPSLFERSFRNQPWLKDTIGFMQNLQDGSSPRKEALSAGPMGSIMRNFPILAALQLLLKSQFRGNEYKNTDYGKQVQSNEMTGRVLEGVSHLDIPEEKQMKKQETFPFPNVQKKVERQIEEKLKQLRELIHSIQKSLNQRKQHDEPNQPSMSNYNNTSRFDLPFQNESRPEEMTHSMKRPRGDKDWNRPRRSRRSSYNNNAPRYEPPFQNESYYNEYGNTDYGRWVGQTERGMTSWEMGPSQDFQGRNDDWSRTDENWIGFDARRDMGRSREPERSYIGPNREQDPDSRNTSSRNRRGQMRSSLGGGSNQRSWDSSSVDRKVDSWSHTYGDIGNSSMNQPNDQWFGNPVNSTGRDTTGAFVDSSKTTNSKGMGYNQRPTNSEGMGYNQKSTNSEGMGYNQRPSNSEGMGYNQGPTNSEGMGYNQGPINSEGMGHNQESTNSEGMGYNQESTNMFDNSQAQDGIMLNIHGGGNNKNGQMQQPYFNAYNTGYQNEGFPSSTVGSQNRLFN